MEFVLLLKMELLKAGKYLLFSTLLFVCKLQTDSKIFDCNLAAKVGMNIANINTEYKYVDGGGVSTM